MTKDISSSDDVIDIRNVIARVEELRESVNDEDQSERGTENDDNERTETLESLLEELAGNGGDEQWEGDWYPISLIRDSYFEDYTRELAEDCGMIPDDAKWPCHCIDWKQAARELQVDYSTIKFDGVTFWFN